MSWTTFCKIHSILLDGALTDTTTTPVGIRVKSNTAFMELADSLARKGARVYHTDNFFSLGLGIEGMSFDSLVEILTPYVSSLEAVFFFDKNAHNAVHKVYCVDPDGDGGRSGFYP
jgi:hypothetical protein